MKQNNTNKDPLTFLTQTNLSSVLYNVCIQHYEDKKKDNPDKPLLPHFVSESLHLIIQDIAKIINNDFCETAYWENIKNNASMTKQVIELRTTGVKGKNNE